MLSTPVPATPVLDVPHLQRRALSIALLILSPGCFIQAWILAGQPQTAAHEPWTFSLVGAIALSCLLALRLTRVPVQIMSACVLLLAIFTIEQRLITVFLTDQLLPAGSHLFPPIVAYVPVIFALGFLLLPVRISLLVSAMVWLLIVATLFVGLLPLATDGVPRSGLLELGLFSLVGMPTFFVLLYATGYYQREISVLQAAASEADSMRRLLRDNEHARRELAQANEALSRQNQDLEHFSAAISHDLKSPIQTMAMMAQMILARDEALTEETRKDLQSVVHNAHDAHVLMDALVRFTRLRRSGVALDEVALGFELAELRKRYSGVVDGKQRQIDIQAGLPTLRCDRMLVQEAFRNLIDNAFKYNDKAEQRVEIGCRTVGKEGVVLFVRDNGIGIEPRDQGRVFDMFKRLNRTREFGDGHGVGLAFVKRIIELHGGWITVESTPGQGTTFLFTLEPKNRKAA